MVFQFLWLLFSASSSCLYIVQAGTGLISSASASVFGIIIFFLQNLICRVSLIYAQVGWSDPYVLNK
jgi:hypothetical protein